MEIGLRRTPAFGVARVELAGGEELEVESGAMMATSTSRGRWRAAS